MKLLKTPFNLPFLLGKDIKAKKPPWGSEGEEQSHWLGCDPVAATSADCFQREFYVFYWDIPLGKEAAVRAGAGSLPATSAVIRLYSSGFTKQKHVYYQATNQTDINLVEAKLKQSFGIIFWFRSHLLSWCKYFLQITLREMTVVTAHFSCVIIQVSAFLTKFPLT